jgi:hypothetical protein
MILYNVTIKINKVLEEEWINWMLTVHIPDVMNTGLFVDHKVCKILHDDNDGGVSYAFQYFCKDMSTFQEYQAKHAKALQNDHSDRYNNQYVAFRTIMEVIQ